MEEPSTDTKTLAFRVPLLDRGAERTLCAADPAAADADAAEVEELRRDVAYLLNSLEGVVVIFDGELRVRRSTRRSSGVFGETEGETAAALVARLGCPELLDDLRAVLADGEPRVRHAEDAGGRSHRLHAAPYRVGESIDGVVLSAADVTPLVAARREATGERERFRRVIAANRDGVWEWPDVRREEMWWSPACYALLGHKPGEAPAVRSEWVDRIHADERDAFRRATDPGAIEPGDDRLDMEYRIRTAGGAYRWVRHRVVIDRDASGRPARMTGSVDDIDDRKAAETRALEGLRNRDNFLAVLSHELRNPLSAIRTATWVLNAPTHDDAGDGAAREAIDRQTDHIARLLDDLLDISRIAQDKISLDLARIDLREAVEGAVQSVAPLAVGHRIAIDVDLPGERVVVDGDVARLQQVFANLLTNAIKYSPDGERVRLELRRDGCAATLRVVDRGAGIEPEMLPRVFEMFVQSEAALRHAHGGIGVGLTLVQKLVELHGGAVVARSEGAGRGCEFEVRLPLADTAHDGGPGDAQSAGEAIHRVERVLLVEDQEDSRRMLSSLLEMQGVEVHGAGGGAEAIALAASIRPDAALIDIGLPEMDGYEVARRLRPLLGERTRLIALTGYGRSDDVRRARDAGFDHHLIKPVDLEQLNGLLGLNGG